MKNKIIIWALVFMVFMITITGALAFDDTSWERLGKDQSTSSWTPYTASKTNFTSTCFVSGSTDTQPVIDNLDGDLNNTKEIVIVKDDVLYVYDTSCNILDSTSDIDLDNRQPSIFDSNDCSEGKAIFILTKDTAEEWCFDGENLTQQNTINLTGIVEDGKAIAMANVSGNPKGAFLTNDTGTTYVGVCTFNGGISCSYNSETDLWWGRKDILPIGSIDLDGDLDFPVLSKDTNQLWIYDFSLNKYNISITTSTEVYEMIMVYDDSPYDEVIFMNRGTGYGGCNNWNIIKVNYAGSETLMHYMLCDSFNAWHLNSNLVQLGEGGDICYFYENDRSLCANDRYFWQCLNSNAVQTSGGLIYQGCIFNTATRITASDMDGDAKADFIGDKGGNTGGIWYYVSSSVLYYEQIDDAQPFWMYALDLDGDAYRDLIMYSDGLNVSLTQTPPQEYDIDLEISDCSTGEKVALAQVIIEGVGTDYTTTQGLISFEDVGAGVFDMSIVKIPDYDLKYFNDVPSYPTTTIQELCIGEDTCGDAPDCSYPCVLWDDFSYTCYLDDFDWIFHPSNPTLRPDTSRLCYNSTGEGVFYAQHLLPTYLDEQIISDEFDMTIYDGVTPIHEFVWYDSTDDDYKNAYYLWWQYNGSNTQLYAQDENHSSYLICEDCWTLGQEHNYKIVQYHTLTGGDLFYNESSGELEPILQNTFYIQIDSNSSKSYYNLPNRDVLDPDNINILNDVTWRWYNEAVCLDNVKVAIGEVFGGGIICSDDYDCLSNQYCSANVCEPLDCNENETIFNHQCVPANQCDDNYDCDFDEQCVGGVCSELDCDFDEVIFNHQCQSDYCSFPSCIDDCKMYDDFSYSCTFEQAGWEFDTPLGSLFEPTSSDEMCLDELAVAEFYFFPDAYTDTGTTEIKFIMEEGGDFYHWLSYLDSTTSELREVYYLHFWEDSGMGYIGYWYLDGGIIVAESLCYDCFGIGDEVSVKIMHFNNIDENYIVENGTNDVIINHNSITLIIDSSGEIDSIFTYLIPLDIIIHQDTLYIYNMPMYEQLDEGHSNMMNYVGFDLSGDICLDEVKVSINTDLENQETLTNEGIKSSHLRVCWDDGEFDWSCCTYEEEQDKSYNCVYRVTALFWLANITQFVLSNILYFLILVIIFVLVTPYLLRSFKGG